MKIYISILILSITIFSCKSPDVVTPTTSTPTTPTPTVTPPVIKSVTTNTVDIKLNSVVLNGEVSDEGGSPVTDRGFYWSETNTIPTDKDNKVQVGSGKGTYSYTLEGLKINTKYYYKSYSTNSKGTSTSDVQTVKTKTLDFKVVSDYTYRSNSIRCCNYLYTFQKSLDGNYLSIEGDYDFDMNLLKVSKTGNVISNFDFDIEKGPKTFLETNNGVLVGGRNKKTGKSFLSFIQNLKITWEKIYSSGEINSIISIPEGGYLLVGNGSSPSGNSSDILIIRIDENGNQIWEKKFGGDLRDNGIKIVKQGNGFIVCGDTKSDNSGNKTTTNKGYTDIWVLKIDINGNKIWEKNLGGEFDDYFKSVLIGDDESIYVLSESGSGVSGDKTEKNNGGVDYWILKLNPNGEKIWDRSLGGSEFDFPKGITKISTDEFLIFGDSYSPISGNKTENRYNSKDYSDYWFVNLDTKGKIIWDKTIGGKYDDNIVNVIFDSSSLEFTCGGVSDSNISFDKTSGTVDKKTNKDFWITNFKYQIKD